MYSYHEKYYSPYFSTINITGICNRNPNTLGRCDCSNEIYEKRNKFPSDKSIYLGIPFKIGEPGEKTVESLNSVSNVLLLKDYPVTLMLPDAIKYKHLVFLHTADFKTDEPGLDGIYRPMRGNPLLGDMVAEYILRYSDGTEYRIPIKRRFNINEPWMPWGEYTFEAVPHGKPHSIRTNTEDVVRNNMPVSWGTSQLRLQPGKGVEKPYYWLYSFENPYTDKLLKEITFVPKDGIVFLFGISYCNLNENPLRWNTRKKIILKLSPGEKLDSNGDYNNVDMDLGSIISVSSVLEYNNKDWGNKEFNNKPVLSEDSVIIEYTAHPDAILYYGEDFRYKRALSSFNDVCKLNLNELNCHKFSDGKPYQDIQDNRHDITMLPESYRKVIITIKEKGTNKFVPARIHIHGEAGEYHAPVNRHRIPNPHWFEDYSTDFVNEKHFSTYINGRAEYKLPVSNIYIEVIKGFEIPPIQKRICVEDWTEKIEIELEHVLPWREKGWVTADTHVHFLSPQTSLLEGEAEGVNVVNLLTTQLGEMFTNIGDFDGKTTIGSKENGGSGEFLVRVGTENRQHILGHISLLGYEGNMILPLTTGGPIESPLGDAVEETLSGWAKQCKKQNGIVILPHFPEPRGESSAVIVLNIADGVELVSPSNLYGGISAYALSDWYRYLNCGYLIAAVGGTDKMSASTAIGTIRTYAKIGYREFNYENWKDAVRRGETFVTSGPLIEFCVNGISMGGVLELKGNGGSVDIEWEVSTVTIPVTSVELVVNGETKEVVKVSTGIINDKGSFSLAVNKSSWVGLRVRGQYPHMLEIIAAHTSPVMVIVNNESCFNRFDAVTILEQIEGASAYIRTIGTRADEKVFKRLMLQISTAHRKLHNRLHMNGAYHNHTAVDQHNDN